MTPTDDALDRLRLERAKIVAALNLTPLVPPQSDDATDNIVNEAWAGLHALMDELQRLRDRLDDSTRRAFLHLQQREAAEAEAQRLTEGLRRILMWATPVGKDFDEDTAFVEIRRIARALLADSPPDDELMKPEQLWTGVLRDTSEPDGGISPLDNPECGDPMWRDEPLPPDGGGAK